MLRHCAARHRLCRSQVRLATTSVVSRASPQKVSALPTRKQAFKDHCMQLRKQDPKRWTARVLSKHFGVPLPNMQAMLVLKGFEEEEAQKAAIDAELVQLADDAEEYLDTETAAITAPPRAARAPAAEPTTFYDREAAAAVPSPPLSSTLASMTEEQEAALVAAVAARFGTPAAAQQAGGAGADAALGAAVRGAMGSMTLEELRVLNDQLVGAAAPNDAAEPTSGDASEESSGEQQVLLRALLSHVCPTLPAVWSEGDSAVGAAADLHALDLPPLPAASAVDGAAAKGARVTREFQNPPDAFWSASALADAESAARFPAVPLYPREQSAAAEAAPPPSADVVAIPIGSATTKAELRQVRAPDLAEVLEFNVQRRNERLAPSYMSYPLPKKGIVFTEVVREGAGKRPWSKPRVRRSLPRASRVWVVDRSGSPREATQDEASYAATRVQPPQFKPRIRRNMW